MSIAVTDKSVMSPTSGALLAESPLGPESEKPPRTGAGRVRLANKTQWALDAMLDAAQEGRTQMEAMLEWIERERLDAKGRYDTARLARLGELSGMVAVLALEVGELERLASDARVGIFEPRPSATVERKTNHAKQ